MDRDIKKYIEQSLNITVCHCVSCDQYTFNGSLNKVTLDEMVSNKFSVVEWQDPNSPDCGNNDGILYVYLPASEDVGELLIGIDVAEQVINVS